MLDNSLSFLANESTLNSIMDNDFFNSIKITLQEHFLNLEELFVYDELKKELSAASGDTEEKKIKQLIAAQTANLANLALLKAKSYENKLEDIDKRIRDIDKKIKEAKKSGRKYDELLKLGVKVTDCNSAFFDVANNFKGCIVGLHEVLRRQGLLDNLVTLNDEKLAESQKNEIDRVYKSYPELNDDKFVKRNLNKWLS